MECHYSIIFTLIVHHDDANKAQENEEKKRAHSIKNKS